MPDAISHADDVVLGLDLGTTACKVVAVDPAGAVLATGSSNHPLHTDARGRAEQAVDQVWASAVRAVRELIEQAPGVGARARAISLSGAMHSLLPTGEAGHPRSQAITWADTRTPGPDDPRWRDAAWLSFFRSDGYRITGCPFQAMYHPLRWRWILHQQEPAWLEADRIVAIKDWAIHRMVGDWVTDDGLASTTGLLDRDAGLWRDDLLDAIELPARRLPRLVASHETVGPLTSAAAAELGLPAGLPVIAGLSDGAAANLGVGAARPGDAAATVGTSGAIRLVTDQPRLDPEQATWSYRFPRDRYLNGGAINNAGAALAWVRRLCYGDIPDDDQAYARLQADARSREPGAAGLRLLPYLSGERCPIYRHDSRAVMTGLTLAADRADLARAVVDAVAVSLREVAQALHRGSGDAHAEPPHQLAAQIHFTGAGARWPVLAQAVADALQTPLLASTLADASALGAAAVARMGLSPQAPEASPPDQPEGRDAVRFDPQPDLDQRYEALAQQLRELRPLALR